VPYIYSLLSKRVHTQSLEEGKGDTYPKPKKAKYMEAKAYCPICLAFFMPKMMEKLAERHIRDAILGLRPLH
jgi:hypothetical protein